MKLKDSIFFIFLFVNEKIWTFFRKLLDITELFQFLKKRKCILLSPRFAYRIMISGRGTIDKKMQIV